jgi:D-glycero-D-manno-heptose 1,7-bisphosphate phosphatase
MRRAVFLDRDGVINRAITRQGKPYPPGSLAELEILPGVSDALIALHEAGFLNIVITNQPDVATGVQSREVVEAMHALLQEQLALDAIKVCFHVESDRCECRKPKPGMLIDAARELDVDLAHSYLVGDRWRDVSAGKAVGCYTFFIDYGYDESLHEKPDQVVESLRQASQHILDLNTYETPERGLRT